MTKFDIYIYIYVYHMYISSILTYTFIGYAKAQPEHTPHQILHILHHSSAAAGLDGKKTDAIPEMKARTLGLAHAML